MGSKTYLDTTGVSEEISGDKTRIIIIIYVYFILIIIYVYFILTFFYVTSLGKKLDQKVALPT